MNRTGKKLTRIAAGAARPTAATRNAMVAARLYAGATLATATAVVSNSVRVLPFRCPTVPSPAWLPGIAAVPITPSS